MWDDNRPDTMKTIISWWPDHWINMFVFVLQKTSNCCKKAKTKKKHDRQESSWFQEKRSAVFHSAICIVLWSGMWKGAEMDLTACAFRSDEIVHRTFWRVEFIVTVSLPSFSPLFANAGAYCSASQPCGDCSMIAVPPRVKIPAIHCPSRAANPEEVKMVSDRSVVKMRVGFTTLSKTVTVRGCIYVCFMTQAKIKYNCENLK